ncbi:lipoprotein [Pilimelia terevasa]|uniref:Lipoprotein n=1 Tax=Pilimelia terevasa TaxID=53372 RepID=A0A8J3BVC2_9ACTN|nr:fasciclin domain-containing protein [Pilimelia terevasa]GGK34298.1 lipoprotein [Pilimelia terevasa]
MRATVLAATSTAAVLALALSGCGMDDGAGDTSAAAPAATTATAPTSTQFGAGCAAVPTDSANPGSFDAMAKVPVATAASGNPLLSTLVTAVKKASLVDSLNTAPALTVFAPTNDAFAKIPKADLDKVLADNKTLTSILTYHVVSGKLTPQNLAGSHPTLQGGSVTVAGSGADFTVNGTSGVVCGNVQTANATVYLIDTVLMPKS